MQNNSATRDRILFLFSLPPARARHKVKKVKIRALMMMMMMMNDDDDGALF